MPRKLTKRVVDLLEARQTRYDVYDKDLPGFVVRVTPDGVKSFGVVYRFGSGRAAPKRRVTIGRYGPLTVEEARQFARATLADVTRGSDPADVRKTSRGASSVSDFGDDFLADVDARRRTSTTTEYRRLWTKHVVPALGSKRVTDVITADVSRLHRGLRATPYGANRVLALLGSFFTYAENQGVRSRGTNPAHDVKPFPEASRERFLKPDEVARLGDALREAEKTGLPIPESLKKKGRGISAKRRAKLTGKKRGPYARKTTPKLQPANPFAVAAIRFLLLTGWREREALTLRWSDLDLDRGLATLPHTKTGKSQRIFGGPARQLLADLPRVKGSPYVFPGKDAESPLVEISRVWYAARAAAGLEDVRLHDLRHSFASVTASGGGSLLLIGKLLGHKNSATTARYAHLLDDPVRAAADTASESLAGWLNASEARKVQPIRSA